MKTAMQIVYEFIEVGEKQYGHQRDALLSELLKRKTELLDKEKEQIERAFKNPYRLARVHPGNNMNKDFEEYWNQTYNQ